MKQKDYNKQRICYNIIFVMLYSLKPGKHRLFYIFNNFCYVVNSAIRQQNKTGRHVLKGMGMGMGMGVGYVEG